MRAGGPYRELTLKSVIGGILVGAVLNVGIVFAGLQIGFTIVGSEVGAIVGLGVLRGLLRRGTILEINIFQSVASTVNMVNAGVIFTVPVLFLLGLERQTNWGALTAATIAGAILGNALIIPLRKQIIDYERLRFPTAVGVAAVLKSPGAGARKCWLLISGIAVSALLRAATLSWGSSLPWIAEEQDLGAKLGLPSGFTFVVAIGLLTVGAGYLAGKHGLAMLYGTVLNFWILVPLTVLLRWAPQGWSLQDLADLDLASASDGARRGIEDFLEAFRADTSRRVGIGMILGGALAGVAVALPALRAALASLRAPPDTGRREELSFSFLQASVLVGLFALFVTVKLVGGESIGWGRATLVTLVGGLWMWLAGLVVAQTTGRTDWSPMSGLALLAVLLALSAAGSEALLPAITVGAAVCVATSMCADMMADLKTGYLVGALPRKQQIAQMATCWIGPGIAIAAVFLLWRAYGFGPEQSRIAYERAEAAGPRALAEYVERGGSPEELASGVPELGAPQAAALQATIEVFRDGGLPLGKYLGGALLGLLISLFVSPGLGVLIGLSLYLPFEYLIMFGFGGLLNMLVARLRGARFAEDEGVPLAAGFIVGDALVSVANALLKVASSI